MPSAKAKAEIEAGIEAEAGAGRDRRSSASGLSDCWLGARVGMEASYYSPRDSGPRGQRIFRPPSLGQAAPGGQPRPGAIWHGG
jgi:hypothetical protein